MPRNSSGIYTLPTGNPVITDTPIASDWGNNTMADIGNEITNSLPRNGSAGMTGPFNLLGNASGQLEAVPFQQLNSAIAAAIAALPGGGSSDTTKLDLTGGTMTGQIIGITPVAAGDLTRKDYVDTKLPLAGGTVTGQIKGITPVAADDLTRKDYVDSVGSTAQANDTKTVPSFRVHNGAAQSVTSGALTVVQLPTVDFEAGAAGWVSAGKFTPQKAGYYAINGTIHGAAVSGMVNVGINIRKNGTTILKETVINLPTGLANLPVTVEVSDIVLFNGTTDFIELVGKVTGTTPQFFGNSASLGSTASGFLIRAT